MSKANETTKVSKSAATVTVASKLPLDVELQLCKKQMTRVTGQYGATSEEAYVRFGPVYTIRGTSYPVGTVPKGFPKQPELTDSGFALTHGVSADWFKEWLEQNAETDFVKNHLIFAASNGAEAEAVGADFANLKSGLEPMNPEGDERSPRPLNSLIQPVKPDVERSKHRHAST